MNAAQLSSQARIENEVLVHMITRLGKIQAEEHPFPHFFLENVFPNHVYQALLAGQPPQSLMHAMSDKHYDDAGQPNRFHMTLHPDNFVAMAREHQDVWFGVHRALTSPQWKQAVFGKLSAGLCLRYGVGREEVSKIEGYPRCSLMRETKGYSIAPHPDGRRKVVTMQYALPVDHSQEDLGTAFYERSLDPRAWLSTPRGFIKVKQMPFRPNCAYAFVVLNMLRKKSWHGRETLAGEQGTRNSILHVYQTEKDADIHTY